MSQPSQQMAVQNFQDWGKFVDLNILCFVVNPLFVASFRFFDIAVPGYIRPYSIVIMSYSKVLGACHHASKIVRSTFCCIVALKLQVEDTKNELPFCAIVFTYLGHSPRNLRTMIQLNVVLTPFHIW